MDHGFAFSDESLSDESFGGFAGGMVNQKRESEMPGLNGKDAATGFPVGLSSPPSAAPTIWKEALPTDRRSTETFSLTDLLVSPLGSDTAGWAVTPSGSSVASIRIF